MLSLSSLIEFLLDMLRDEATQQDFARDPSATLAARGLSDVTAQDVRDVQPMLADVGGVTRLVHEPAHHAPTPQVHHAFSAGTHAGGHGGAPDVVREIHHVAREFTVARPVVHTTQEYKTYNSYTEFTTDNSVHAEEGATVVQDSYNQDNDGVDNKGGVIADGATVAGDDMGLSGNDTATTTVEGSGTESQTQTGSGNVTVVVDGEPAEETEESGGGSDDGPASITYGEPYGSDDSGDPGGDSEGYSGDVNDSYSAQSSSSAAEESDGAEHAAAHA